MEPEDNPVPATAAPAEGIPSSIADKVGINAFRKTVPGADPSPSSPSFQSGRPRGRPKKNSEPYTLSPEMLKMLCSAPFTALGNLSQIGAMIVASKVGVPSAERQEILKEVEGLWKLEPESEKILSECAQEMFKRASPELIEKMPVYVFGTVFTASALARAGGTYYLVSEMRGRHRNGNRPPRAGEKSLDKADSEKPSASPSN